jgi:hypothetical protein
VFSFIREKALDFGDHQRVASAELLEQCAAFVWRTTGCQFESVSNTVEIVGRHSSGDRQLGHGLNLPRTTRPAAPARPVLGHRGCPKDQRGDFTTEV